MTSESEFPLKKLFLIPMFVNKTLTIHPSFSSAGLKWSVLSWEKKKTWRAVVCIHISAVLWESNWKGFKSASTLKASLLGTDKWLLYQGYFHMETLTPLQKQRWKITVLQQTYLPSKWGVQTCISPDSTERTRPQAAVVMGHSPSFLLELGHFAGRQARFTVSCSKGKRKHDVLA